MTNKNRDDYTCVIESVMCVCVSVRVCVFASVRECSGAGKSDLVDNQCLVLQVFQKPAPNRRGSCAGAEKWGMRKDRRR